MSRFSGQVVFVTGGTSGLGLAASQLFIKEGAQVFVADIEERSVIKHLGAEKAHFMRCDVSDPDNCEKAITACIEKFGRLDVLFSNAGILCPYEKIPNQRIDVFQRVIQIDLNSLFYLARVAVPYMQNQGKGNIIATASTSGLGGEVGVAPYTAAKAGLINLCRVLALEYALEGIRVNAVCPGHMITPMADNLLQSPQAYELARKAIPMGRGCQPIEVAKVVLFLASDDASYVTGQGKFAPPSFSSSSLAHFTC